MLVGVLGALLALAVGGVVVGAALLIRSAKQAGTMIEVIFPPTRVLAE